MKHARPDYNRIQDPAGLIPDDEPVFLLRGQDATAPDVVRNWAYMQAKGSEIRRMALEHANAMDCWPVKKTADLPKPVPFCCFCGNTAQVLEYRHLASLDIKHTALNICEGCVAHALRRPR